MWVFSAEKTLKITKKERIRKTGCKKRIKLIFSIKKEFIIKLKIHAFVGTCVDFLQMKKQKEVTKIQIRKSYSY